jgi:AcrR family transcriptional regulator
VIRGTELASGTFYNYFADKEEVFRAVLDQSAREIRRRLRRARAEARNVQELVGGAYRTWFEFLVEDELVFELMRRNAGPIRARMGDPMLGAAVDELLEDLRAAIARGELPGFEPDYMAGAMAGAALELASAAKLTTELRRSETQQLEQLRSAMERVGDRGRAVERQCRAEPSVDLGHQHRTRRDARRVELGQRLQPLGVCARAVAQGDASHGRGRVGGRRRPARRLAKIAGPLARQEQIQLTGKHHATS